MQDYAIGLEALFSLNNSATPSAARQVTGAMMICLGVALLAMYGYGGGPVARLDVGSFVFVIIGAGISGVLPGFRSVRTT